MIRQPAAFEAAILDTLAVRLGMDPVDLRRPLPLSPAASEAAARTRGEWARQAAARSRRGALIAARLA